MGWQPWSRPTSQASHGTLDWEHGVLQAQPPTSRAVAVRGVWLAGFIELGLVCFLAAVWGAERAARPVPS
jgi:hypothetical protein